MKENTKIIQEQEKLFKDLEQVLQGYEQEIEKSKFKINQIENIYNSYNKKLLNFIKETIYKQQYIYCYSNRDFSKSILKECKIETKNKISEKFIEKCLKFYDILLQKMYYWENLFYISDFNDEYNFSSIGQNLLYALSSLNYYKGEDIIGQIQGNFLQKILIDKQTIVRLIIEDDFIVCSFYLKNLFISGYLLGTTKFIDEAIASIIHMVDKLCDEHGFYYENNLIGAISDYYKYIFRAKTNELLNSDTIENIFYPVEKIYDNLEAQDVYNLLSNVKEFSKIIMASLTKESREIFYSYVNYFIKKIMENHNNILCEIEQLYLQFSKDNVE